MQFWGTTIWKIIKTAPFLIFGISAVYMYFEMAAAEDKLAQSTVLIKRHEATIAVLNGEIEALQKAYAYRQTQDQMIEEKAKVKRGKLQKAVSTEKAVKDWGDSRLPDTVIRMLNNKND